MKMLIAKLNPTCKKALEAAAALCVTKGHYNIELEHFLIKLLDPVDSDIQIILRYYEIDLQTVSRQLISAIEKLSTGNTSSPVISRHILNVLEQAWLISSLKLGGQTIRSGSILSALIDVDPLRGIILENCPLLLRIPRLSFVKDINELLKTSNEDSSSSPPSQDSESITKVESLMNSSFAADSALEQYTENLTQAAKNGKLDPIFGRESEIRQVIDVLTRRRQNNPILVGEAGVGKTAIVEGLAQRICQNDVPPSLQDVHIHKLDLGLLQAGASAKGQFEERLNRLLQEIKNSPYPIVLFIDEAHALMGAGGTQGLGDAANLLKPSLARGELRTIAATTWSEYKRYFEKDAALVRRFEKVKVKEPNPEQAISMLRLIAEKYQQHHKVPILNEAIEAAARLSHRFLPERRLPDKALTVLDTACAQVSLSRSGKPEELQTCLSQINLLGIELQMLKNEEHQVLPSSLDKSDPIQKRTLDLENELNEAHHHYEELSKKWEEQYQIVKQVEGLRKQIQNLGSNEASSVEITLLQRQLTQLQQSLVELPSENVLVSQAVDQVAVARVIANWTGIPLGTILAQGNRMSLGYLLNVLKTRIVGQESALTVLAQSIVNYHVGLTDTNKPIGIFILAGPSGVGKTETALALAEILTGNSRHLVRLNMGEFQESHSISILKGAPPGYVGYGKGGTLTEAVRQNPYSVILVDEVDKAHEDVISLFAQIFDKGILEDSEGVEVDFSNTLFVLTTNQGAEIISERCYSLKETEDKAIVFAQLNAKVTDELTKVFGTPFIARTTVVPYLPLGIAEIEDIIRQKLAKIEQRLKEKHKYELSYSEEFIQKIAQDFIGHKRGIRAIEMYLSQNVVPQLAEAALNQKFEAGEIRKINIG
ncbi:MAG: type VI secretion system ATPase TssH [Alphaproteobacteria bacterium]|nr:type VI secretion system ATPase TssH [Alphaproteobacteria bacterium]